MAVYDGAEVILKPVFGTLPASETDPSDVRRLLSKRYRVRCQMRIRAWTAVVTVPLSEPQLERRRLDPMACAP